MDLGLAEKIILVTGGAKGIGRGIADSLASEGAIPVIVGRNEKDNEKAVAEITGAGGKSDYLTAELTAPQAPEQVVAAVLKKFGAIDGLVNNAGANDGVGLETGSYDTFMASLHKNMIHYYLMAHHALRALKESKGAIVNISSKTAETGQGHTSGYAASNGGRNALTREWAVELLPDGIRVNAVIVAECWTPLYERWINSLPDPQEKRKAIELNIPLGNRMTRPGEIADMVAFLLSERSAHTTGQLIHVDGGYVHLDRSLAR